MDTAVTIENKRIKRIHPQKFALWLAMASITMMFGAFTSAYIVKHAAGNWLDFRLPDIFFISTMVLLASSITLESSYRSFVKGNEKAYKSLLVISGILGIAFVTFQYMGWNELFSIGIDLKGNPSGSFLYLITGVHAAHILGGVAAITVACIHAFSLKYKVTDQRKHRFQLVVQYWHFVDLLWIYLLLFLLLYK
ncbi:MAG: cytochrome oxidase subunit III [Saprospiraceae bacterium]|nr:cytochrome oxidase subunit III [Saprospiraceae bacterium]